MKQPITILTIFWLFSSCATLLNQPTTYVHVKTTKPAIIVCGKDSIKTEKEEVLLTLERSKNPATFTAIWESVKKQITINSKNSFAYKYNIFNLGIGLLVDRNSPKRYEYPSIVKINPYDTITTISRHIINPQKGDLFFHVSLPHINNFYLCPDNEDTKSNTGFWGITVGLDFFHNNKQFINFSASAVSDFFCPVPAAIDISGEYELMTSSYFSLSNNHKIKRVSFGYGISYGRNSWDFRYYDRFDPPPPTRLPIKKSYYSLGFVFPAYFQSGRRFNIGVIYRPTFLRFDTQDNLKYEHLISIDFAWKIRINQYI